MGIEIPSKQPSSDLGNTPELRINPRQRSLEAREGLRRYSDEATVEKAGLMVRGLLDANPVPGIVVGETKILSNGLIQTTLMREDGHAITVALTEKRLARPEIVEGIVRNAVSVLQTLPPKEAEKEKPEEQQGVPQSKSTKEALAFIEYVAEKVRNGDLGRSEDPKRFLQEMRETFRPPTFESPSEFMETVHRVIGSSAYSGSRTEHTEDLPYKAKMMVVHWLNDSIKGKEGFGKESLALASFAFLLGEDPKYIQDKKFAGKDGQPDVKKVLTDYWFHHRREYNEFQRLSKAEEAKLPKAEKGEK